MKEVIPGQQGSEAEPGQMCFLSIATAKQLPLLTRESGHHALPLSLCEQMGSAQKPSRWSQRDEEISQEMWQQHPGDSLGPFSPRGQAAPLLDEESFGLQGCYRTSCSPKIIWGEKYLHMQQPKNHLEIFNAALTLVFCCFTQEIM